ncbi:hypothetical protein M231_03798 [Tremella mesenterica]|uniref:NADP-dependent oxidoreductase domain-containing protein n=1 Tax=Tremella mesenterica TaxID=5217 RepID=A0A4Q1BMA3_TREME|nr:hypothetical protein M231_03798 [Tremella mesenterica]
MSIPTVTLPVIGRTVGKMGLGTMMLSMTPGVTEEGLMDSIKAGVDAGSNLLVSGSFYGPPRDRKHNLKLLGKFFAKYPEYVDKVVLSVKGGFDPASFEPTSDINWIREDLLTCKSHLGKKNIDIFEFARVPLDIPIEEAMKNLLILQKEGLFSSISLSEATASTFKRALSVTPIVFNELEVSLWSVEQPILDAVAAAAEVGVPVLAYSPLGRGFLTGQFRTVEDVKNHPLAAFQPRLAPELFDQNIKLVNKVEEIAKRHGHSVSEFALAWVINKFPTVIPIPGSSKVERVKSNVSAANIKISSEEMEEIEQILKDFPPVGGRYPDQQEQFLVSRSVLISERKADASDEMSRSQGRLDKNGIVN